MRIDNPWVAAFRAKRHSYWGCCVAWKANRTQLDRHGRQLRASNDYNAPEFSRVLATRAIGTPKQGCIEIAF
jgi:hypothetical protein